MPSSARRFTFRTTIMSLFLFLLLGTVAAVWTFSNRHALFPAAQLAPAGGSAARSPRTT